MIALIVSLRVDPARAPSFEGRFAEFARSVLAKEPGTLTYCLAKSRDEADLYRAIEIYADEAAFRAHVAADAFQAFRPVLLGFLREPPRSERMDVVG